MTFWIFATIMVIGLAVLMSYGGHEDPLGGDGNSGCLTRGCLMRVAIFILALVLALLAVKLYEFFDFL